MDDIAEEMNHLNKLAKQHPGKRFDHLWENIIHPLWLAQAWEQIRRNKGSQSAGVDNTIAVDVDMSLIHKLADELKTLTYRPKPVRRVYIPKTNGKTRPLGIPTIKDRIVQQALKMLLEPIFEADFRHCSHGFRPGRSTHTALRDLVRVYANTGYIIEGDIENCYDTIPHSKLLQQVGRRVSDKKILSLIRAFLKAGYLEDWQYHRTYSGTPQGGIISPLLANIFLHQLDEFLIDELKANRGQTQKEVNSRRNPEYMRINRNISKLRRSLKESGEGSRKLIIKELTELERQQRRTPCFAKDKKHPCKIKYVRYADDFVILVAGNKAEAEAIKNRINQKFSEIGLKLSEEKTKLTHWSKTIQFLGYNICGELKKKGVGLRAILSIPKEKLEKAKDAVTTVCGYYHIPEADAIAQLNASFRGWCNYYRYANSPQRGFQKLSSHSWWQYAHYLARKQKSSIAKMIKREKVAGRLGEIKKGHRTRTTFQLMIGDKKMILNIFPPKTGQIRDIVNNQDWDADLKPVKIMNWQSGRSLATRLAAMERARGVCERCREKAVEHVHHSIPIKRKRFFARVRADKDQRETAIAVCKGCHLEAHEGSFGGKRKRSGGNAGYAERCLSGVGSAVERPIAEM
jgi:group II intron reverse transcriptase/maturase